MVVDEDLDLTERYAERARRLEDRAAETTPDSYARRGSDWDDEVLNPLRTIDRKAEDRLREREYLEENVGAECTSLRDWKDRREQVADEELYLYLLRDCVEAHFVFYKLHHLYEDDEEFREAVQDGEVGMQCEQKIVETLAWLEEIDAPTELSSRQHRLSSWSQ